MWNLNKDLGDNIHWVGIFRSSMFRSLAKFSRIPVVVTNQVRSQSMRSRDDTIEESARFDSHLIPSLGIHWSHAVTIRLVLEAKSG
ncbi:unnamed protein product [Camellia sinensis]